MQLKNARRSSPDRPLASDLAIATALAQAGANIVMNGLGSEADNLAAVRQVAKAGTRVAFDGADMLRHNQIAAMIEQAERDFGSVDILVNNAGIQLCRRWRSSRSRSGTRSSPSISRPRSTRCGRCARHEAAQLGPHHQHLLGAFAGRLAVQGRLRGGQAWAGGLYEGGGARAGGAGVTAECHLAGVRVDAAGGEAASGSGQVERHHARGSRRRRWYPISRPVASCRWRRSAR